MNRVRRFMAERKLMRTATIVIAGCLSSTLALAESVSMLVVDKDGKPTPDAVVILVPSNKASSHTPILPKEITVVQEKMQFIPAVSIVPLGGKVKFVNNDSWDHHIRALLAGAAQFSSEASAGFALRLIGKSEGKPAHFMEVTVDKPGAIGATLIGCFIHGSMRGNLYVTDSPWAAKTGVDGVATFADVPEGALQVKVWQADQLIDLPVQQAHVSNGPLKLKAQLQVAARRPRVEPASGLRDVYLR
jgi:plastocyanin